MDISIVIVNYNVKHFLEQCLHSVYKALTGIQAEIFVVDNNSVDGSCQIVREKFPQVKLIENKENVGFAKANNQAIRKAVGRYILLLNPDTFVQEDTLKKCIDFCDRDSTIGGLGIKMIDGKGNFLPESKRSLPTPQVAFFKIFGLSSLFPKSKVFGKYHLGYLDKDKNHEVEILAGAFMMLRKEALDKTGLLDETFFMYGEDIDLSYRIILAGYKNYYFADSTIIHYKGESTKKGSINYVLVFYRAMIIFAQKHFSNKNARIYSLFINIAIYIRAALGIVRRVLLKLFEPVVDFLAIYLGFLFFIPIWELHKLGAKDYYPTDYYLYVIPSYILIWLFFIFYAGGYEKRIHPINLFKGVVFGTFAIIVVYAFLPEDLRYSRALILLGSLWTFGSVFVSRLFGTYLFKENRKLLIKNHIKRIATIGSKNETERVLKILRESGKAFSFIGFISPNEKSIQKGGLGCLKQLEEIVKINKIDELIFCSEDIEGSAIIESMLATTHIDAEYKIAPPESASVIGSNSINTTGDLYVVDLNSLSTGINKRKKRTFDFTVSIMLLITWPVFAFVIRSSKEYLRNIVFVLFGKYTWVNIVLDKHHIPGHENIIKGVLSPEDAMKQKKLSGALKERISIMYAKDYRVVNDIVIMFKGFKYLGRKMPIK